MQGSHRSAADESISLGDVYYLLFRHKGKILFFSALGVIAAAWVFIYTPSVYESEAALLVRYVSDTTVLDAVTSERITAPGRGGENIINSEIAILSSRDLVEKVVDEMGVNRFSLDSTNVSGRARIAEKVMSSIRIEAPKNSSIIRITFDGPTPTVAQEFLRRLTESYLLKHIEIHRAAGAYEFLAQQTDQLRSRLSETEEELRQLKYAEGIVSIEDTKKNIAQRTEELTRGLNELETLLAAARARAEVMGAVLATTGSNLPTLIVTSENAADVPSSHRVQLARLQQKEAELLSVYTADSIPVKSIREQIREIERLLDAERSAGVSVRTTTNNAAVARPSPMLVEEQANIAALEAKIGVQRDLLKRAVNEAKKIDSVESRIVQLQRSKELQEANYKYFCQSLERARVDEALNSGRISNISIVQPATLPAKKLRLKLPRNMGLALMFGVACGVGLALLSEYFVDHSIRRPEEVPAVLRVPLIMSLPLLDAGRSSRRLARGARGSLLLNAHGPQQKDMRELPEGHGQSEMGDLYDALRERILSQIGTDTVVGPYMLGVTSCTPGAGVSTIVAGLALALARSGAERIVVMDVSAESGTPTLFGVNPVTGLVEMTSDGEGNTAVAQHQVYVVPSGSSESKPVYSNRAQRLAAVIQGLRNSKADYVIVDMPPVTETGLTLRISRLLNSVLLVIAAEKVNRSVAAHVKDWLLQADAKILGSVLNKRRQYVPEWLYHSYWL